MLYEDKLVGELDLPDGSNIWLINASKGLEKNSFEDALEKIDVLKRLVSEEQSRRLGLGIAP